MSDIIVCADIFDLCAAQSDASIDMILCDLPYGTTECVWDAVIPFVPMWKAFERIIKPFGSMIFTASQPFASLLTVSNLSMFKYEWVWHKNRPTGMMNARSRPMKVHDNILVFSPAPTTGNQFNEETYHYYPQGTQKCRKIEKSKSQSTAINHIRSPFPEYYFRETSHYPQSIINFDFEIGYHPTQKPTPLFEYLIRTYTQPGELVFDPCVGSGTTAIAARKVGRHFICGDSSPEYVKIANERLKNTDPYQDRNVAASVVQHSLFAGVMQ